MLHLHTGRQLNIIEQAINQIEELFNSDLTDYRISKDTGITLSVIQKYRNDTSKLENMTLKIANKLMKYTEELKMRKDQAFKTLETIKKHSEEGNICFSIVDKKTGEYLTNSDTGNGWRIFGFSHLTIGGKPIPEHMYGVYGDFLYRLGYDSNQIDNRFNSDEEILDAINRILIDFELKVD